MSLDSYDCNCSKTNYSQKNNTKCPTIKSCGNITPTSFNILTTPVTVTSLITNTSCINNPCTLLNFKGTLFLSFNDGVALTANQTLSFQLVKSNLCFPGNNANLGDPITLTLPNGFFPLVPISIDFNFCDCSSCSDNCCCNFNSECIEYSIVVTGGPVSVAITGPNLTATTYSCGCTKNNYKPDCSSAPSATCPTVISCSNPLPRIPTTTTPALAASLIIDTSCIDNPCTELDFTSVAFVSSTAGGGTGSLDNSQTLSFQFFKRDLCNPENIIKVGNPFAFAFPANLSDITPVPIYFTFCDCNNSTNCCCHDFNSQCIEYDLFVTGGVDLVNLDASILTAMSTCKYACPCDNKCY